MNRLENTNKQENNRKCKCHADASSKTKSGPDASKYIPTGLNFASLIIMLLSVGQSQLCIWYIISFVRPKEPFTFAALHRERSHALQQATCNSSPSLSSNPLPSSWRHHQPPRLDGLDSQSAGAGATPVATYVVCFISRLSHIATLWFKLETRSPAVAATWLCIVAVAIDSMRHKTSPMCVKCAIDANPIEDHKPRAAPIALL